MVFSLRWISILAFQLFIIVARTDVGPSPNDPIRLLLLNNLKPDSTLLNTAHADTTQFNSSETNLINVNIARLGGRGSTNGIDKNRFDKRGESKVLLREDADSSVSIRYRCYGGCERDTCGGGTANSCSVSKRFHENMNQGVNTSHDIDHELKSRVFKVGPYDHQPPKILGRYQARYVINYLSTQMGTRGLWDFQYGALDSNINGFLTNQPPRNMGTVRRQEIFQDSAFQFATGSVRGCTMMTVISRRAVWMAHFWEVWTDFDDRSGALNWRINVLNAFSNSGPVRTDIDAPQGPPIDLSLFNRQGDNTAAYIFTPLNPEIDRDDYTFGTVEFTSEDDYLARLEYGTKIEELIEHVRGEIFGVRIVVFGYVRLDYTKPEQEDEGEHFRSDRGIVMFQYDPDSGLAGEEGEIVPGYRLFYQQAVLEAVLGNLPRKV